MEYCGDYNYMEYCGDHTASHRQPKGVIVYGISSYLPWLASREQ